MISAFVVRMLYEKESALAKRKAGPKPEPEYEHCNGPTLTPGTILDSTDPAGKARMNNPYKPSMEFCEHGYQYSHPIKPE